MSQPPTLSLLPNSNITHSTPQTLTMRRDPQGDYFLISSTSIPDVPIYQIDAPSFSVSYKKLVTDLTTNTPLFTIRNIQPSKNWTCLAEVPPGSGNIIFETQLFTNVLGGFRIHMMFQNVATDNQREKLELKVPPWSKTQSVTYNNIQIGSVSRASHGNRESYTLTVSPNVDPLLVIVMVTIMDAKAREHADLVRRANRTVSSTDGIAAPGAMAFVAVGASGGGGF